MNLKSNSIEIPYKLSKLKFNRSRYIELRNYFNSVKINTICNEGNCPNKYECYSRDTATFMILGDKCTRNCLYCNVSFAKDGIGIPLSCLVNEPFEIANAVSRLNLKYIVLTCVTRDDLLDYGIGHFISCVNEINKKSSNVIIEFLSSDLGGNNENLKKLLSSSIEVLNHNVETVPRLFSVLRSQGDYERSLMLLLNAKIISKNMNKKIKTKSGLMVGLGETKKEIINVFSDLRKVNCDFLSIGQYMAPSEKHFKVVKYYTKKEFDELKKIGLEMGFSHIESGPFVRSSYNAIEYLK